MRSLNRRNIASEFPGVAIGFAAITAALTITVNAADWPCFRGPNGDGHTDEKITIWPPQELWRANVNQGFSEVVVSNGKVYTMGWSNNQDTVYCFSESSSGTNPTPLWATSYAAGTKGSYSGTYGAPAVSSDGKVYTFSVFGLLNCFDAASGSLLWSNADLYVSNPYWGMGCSPLVEGDLVVVNSGADGNAAYAISRTTHNKVWGTIGNTTRLTSPFAITLGGQRTIISCGQSVYGLDPANGNVLWSFAAPYPPVDIQAAIANPLIVDSNKVYTSQGYNCGSAMANLGGSGALAKVWGNTELRTWIHAPVAYGGYVYGVSEDGVLKCIDSSNGSAKWSSAGYGTVSAVLSAGNQVIVMNGQNNSMPGDYSGNGSLVVAQASSAGYTELFRTNGIMRNMHTWTAPTLCNGRLYLRSQEGSLVCYKVGETPAQGCSTKITFSGYNQPGTLTNFPALVALSTNIAGFDYAQFSSQSGGDLRFTASDGTTELNYEVDTWNTNGTSYAWVQVPRLTSGTYIWAFWGNANLTAPPYTTNGATWDSTFAGVWHQNEAVTNGGHQHDSTANHNDAIFMQNSSSTCGVSALIGGGNIIQGLYAGLRVSDNASIDVVNHCTMSMWAKNAVGNNLWANGIMMGKTHEAPAILYHGGDPLDLRFAYLSGQWEQADYIFPSAVTWQFLTGIFDAATTNIYFYGNGRCDQALSHNTNMATPIPEPSGDLLLGYDPGSPGLNTQYMMDEVRLENVPRPSNWVWSCYMTVASNRSFQTYGIVQGSGYIPVPGTLQFSASAYSVVENGGVATIMVTRTNGSSGTVTVNYSTANGTAIAGSDYTAANGTLTFADSETSKTFTVTILDDGVPEPDKTVNLAISSPGGGASLGNRASAVLTIVDDDRPMLQFSSATYEVSSESSASVMITVTRSKVTSGAVGVSYSTANGTATAPSDYTATSGTLSFADGETSKTFSIPITHKSVYEADKTVNLTLSNPTGGTYGALVGSPGTAVLTIVGPPMPTSYDAWSNRVRITFSGYSRTGTLTNFPALVVLGANISGFTYSQFASSSGGDLRFTDNSGTNTLRHEIDTWSTSGKSYVWVQIPQFTNNCSIWAFWGNAGATTPPGYTTDGSTWDANFVGVWHMNSTTSADATTNHLNVTGSFGNTNVTGMIGGGQGFAASSSTHMVVPNSSKMVFGSSDSYVVSTWAYVPSTPSGWHAAVAKSTDIGTCYGISQLDNNWVYNCEFGLWNGGSIAVGTWSHVEVMQIAPGNLGRFVYVNGALTTSAPGVNSSTVGAGDLWFGGAAGSSQYFNGLLDEVRIEKTIRSDNWIWACYMTVGNNSSFTTYGTVRGSGGSSGTAAKGTPVSWLQSHGFSSNFDAAELTDADGDGAQAWQEYIAGTDPGNAQSALGVSVQRIANGVVISFPSLSATGSDYAGKVRYYKLESSTNLALGWQPVYSNLVGNDAPVIYMNTSPVRLAYYRARARLQ
jgi:hypothetical protein